MEPRYLADDWLLLTDADAPRRQALAEAARRSGDWEEVVPGLDSLALKFDPARVDGGALGEKLGRLSDAANAAPAAAPEPVTLHACYDAAFGPDQALVAEALGITVEALPAWHQAQEWTVAMLGFLPGFGYLANTLDCPQVPRLADPRARVAAGSIGLLGRQCGVYASEGPGGWPLIGRVAERLFDPSRRDPATLQAGQTVRFVAIDQAAFDARQRGKAGA